MKTTKREWVSILRQMSFYNRKTGFVDYDRNNKLCFFDTDPWLNGVCAFFVTKEMVVDIINNYDNERK